MNIYTPFHPKKIKNSNRLIGHGQGIFHKIVKGASNLAQTASGGNFGTGTQSEILNTGANVVDSVLAGTSPQRAIKRGATRLRKKLTGATRRKLKSKILGKKKSRRKMRGGALLYKLKRKQKPKPIYDLYRLRKGKIPVSKRTKKGGRKKSRRKRRGKKRISKRGQRGRKRKSKSIKKSTQKSKFHISNFFKKKRKPSRKRKLSTRKRNSSLFGKSVFDI